MTYTLADAPTAGIPPVLRLRRGEPFVAKFTNRLDEPTTVHWHGLRVPNRMDGVPFLTQPYLYKGRQLRLRLYAAGCRHLLVSPPLQYADADRARHERGFLSSKTPRTRSSTRRLPSTCATGASAVTASSSSSSGRVTRPRPAPTVPCAAPTGRWSRASMRQAAGLCVFDWQRPT